jgi:predicted nucleic acid-binding protein
LSHFFLDSSALVKRYLEEDGTEWILAITAPEAEHVVVVAQIAPVEVLSGVMRRAREGLLGERATRDARLLIDRHARLAYQVIALTDDVIRRAEDLLERHALRASDAIQLASALEASERLDMGAPGGLQFVSADVRLLAAAAREGLTTIDPNTRI